MLNFIIGLFVGGFAAVVFMSCLSIHKINKVEELEEKHWNECMQIAQYDDELQRCRHD